MSWRIVYAGQPLDTDPTEYEDHAQAICSIVFRLGVSTQSTYTPDGEFAVRALDTNEIVARIVPVKPTKLVHEVKRRAALTRWRGLSWVGWLNYLVLRWFFFRLTYKVDEETGERISGYYFSWVPSWRW